MSSLHDVVTATGEEFGDECLDSSPGGVVASVLTAAYDNEGH